MVEGDTASSDKGLPENNEGMIFCKPSHEGCNYWGEGGGLNWWCELLVYVIALCALQDRTPTLIIVEPKSVAIDT